MIQVVYYVLWMTSPLVYVRMFIKFFLYIRIYVYNNIRKLCVLADPDPDGKLFDKSHEALTINFVYVGSKQTNFK